ncbi:MAG: hypothetical protein EOS36_10440 [Mesorhizobium sp.]|nr:MAG: hypothetical protein EOS36_10440 [Mesorhizobium sp.]RWE38722.1 MAG: hypothetical protein EOS79_22560 [Mesorhizobium sp.]
MLDNFVRQFRHRILRSRNPSLPDQFGVCRNRRPDLIVFTQFRTENRFTLLLQLLSAAFRRATCLQEPAPPIPWQPLSGRGVRPLSNDNLPAP